jgi:peptidoglycan/xylan/chitin deacetylase (PgdA/CDA1 family)
MKKLLFAVLRGAGVTRLAAWWHRDRTVFLCYHSVTKQPRPTRRELKLHVPLAVFVKHLDYLQSHYRVVSLGDYLAARESGRRLPDYAAVVTFDDGMRNFLTVVAPLLKERRLAATAFVITQRAAERDNTRFDEEWTPLDSRRYLSWPEIRALAGVPGITIGSHSHTHPDLTTLTEDEARSELLGSLAAITEQTGVTRPALAYPHGRAGARVRALAEAAGYSCGLTGELGANDIGSDLYGLRRVVIAGDDDVSTFAARVSGLTWWYDRLRSSLRKLKSNAFGEGDARGPEPSAQGEAVFTQTKKPSPESTPCLAHSSSESPCAAARTSSPPAASFSAKSSP